MACSFSSETQEVWKLQKRDARYTNMPGRILVDSGKIQHVREEKDIRMLKIAVTPDDELNHLFRTFYAQEVKEGLHVEYMERNAEELLRMVHHHRVDIGFLLVDQNQKTALLQMLTHKRLEFTEIGKRSPVLLAGPRARYMGQSR